MKIKKLSKYWPEQSVWHLFELRRFRTDSKTSLSLWIFKTWWKSYQKHNFRLVESLYHLESFNFLERTNKPAISLLIKLYWQQLLLNPWHPFDKMKRCLKTFIVKKPKDCWKYILNAGNALRRKDCVIRANNCTTFFSFFPSFIQRYINADLKLFLYVLVYIKGIPWTFSFFNTMSYCAFYQ